MRVSETSLPGVKLLAPVQHRDHRGIFCEVYNRRTLAAAGIVTEFVQDNMSHSAAAGTIRGFHFQIPPFAQAKLVYVARGSVFDVVVDLRRGSPTYGRHFAAVLSAAGWEQIFVPVGVAHAVCTLEPDTLVVYKVSAHYAPEHDRGLLWSDPALGIAWPVALERAIVSEKDSRHPRLAELPDYFVYEGPAAAPTAPSGRAP
ncbi:MAG: dTDP-4-dehydrorhamnose 3,5-epimerase [Rhodospirillaceae bacterium]|nr:dTDP-4-dehydrorhamnose 3,5-epimerase [Rhodospirillaceae bacterium]